MARHWFKYGSVIILLLVVLAAGGRQSAYADQSSARYFSQTGYGIDNDTIWDYFNHRGGVATFGYPVSRAVLFEGFTVQFFQRRIVQLDQNGTPRLLNVLDPGLMPYTRFNGAIFPSADSGVVAGAPSPADQAATLGFVSANAPDLFAGLPVNFHQTFINTVPLAVAFPNGGNAGLLPGFDLEMWGVPTSQPAFDSNNHNFVYLRFQRGIMMYDAGCTCTQAVLLADYLKGILIGLDLPPDLTQDAKNSPLFAQYAPGVPGSVRDSASLPGTDLTNAFTPGPPSPPVSAKPVGGGTLAGVVTDTSGRPISGAFVTVGFKSFKLVGQADANGHYSVTGIPDTAGVEVFSFAPGFVYDHSGGFPIPTGQTTTFNVKLASDVNPALEPVLSDLSVSPATVSRGDAVTFSVSVQSSQQMSDEVIAASGQLGRSALFTPVGGGRYQATFTVPTDIPPGTYSFAVFGATEQCEENAVFLTVAVAVT